MIVIGEPVSQFSKHYPRLLSTIIFLEKEVQILPHLAHLPHLRHEIGEPSEPVGVR